MRMIRQALSRVKYTLLAVVAGLTLALALVAIAGSGLAVSSPTANNSQGNSAQTSTDTRPNIVFVMTDDMPPDLLTRMPHVRDRIKAQGLTLSNAYVSQSLCCPSRATILRGQYSHNTGILRNDQPNGGWEDFKGFGLEADTVARWVQSAGYRTGFVGKYMNQYDASVKPPYWSYWFGRATAQGVSWNKVNENGTVIDYRNDPRARIDIERDKALGFIDRNTDELSDPPFILFMWPSEPHLPAVDYPDRYASLYTNEPLNPKPSFDEADVSDKPQWIRNRPRITDEQRTTLTDWKRNQLRSLRGVDDAVDAILDKLESRGELANTYVIFTTDNGTHMGEHRFWFDNGAKNTPYEEAANVPFVVRGPGVPAGVSRSHLILNNDLGPTFAQIAGATTPSFVDGRSLLPVWAASPPATWRTAVLNERPPGAALHATRIYHAVMTKKYTYVEYASGEKELYDRTTDPYQLQSIHQTANSTTLTNLHNRLQSLKVCAEASAVTCRKAEGG
jgi:arylsulfatase A-like enzyme